MRKLLKSTHSHGKIHLRSTVLAYGKVLIRVNGGGFVDSFLASLFNPIHHDYIILNVTAPREGSLD